MYLESILEKLNNPNLQDKNNPGHKIIDGCIAEYLEHYDNHILDVFLTHAHGGYLDLHAREYGLARREGETDAELRGRILTEEFILQSTPDFLGLGVVLWVYQSGVVDDKNTLTSRNSYLKEYHDTGYVFIGTGVESDYLRSKFILKDILWI